ncbi:hypothetical protein Hamer_G019138 [Homarus americanus]|uniref:Uncharacterized protein n=1 Tax=Homarus americanus TaxID=6706 RepID=A0A8J5MUJ7_HOMAM|nr:hypothetical protein Hamer_G019138 [Homarus americanus]
MESGERQAGDKMAPGKAQERQAGEESVTLTVYAETPSCRRSLTVSVAEWIPLNVFSNALVLSSSGFSCWSLRSPSSSHLLGANDKPSLSEGQARLLFHQERSQPRSSPPSSLIQQPLQSDAPFLVLVLLCDALWGGSLNILI